MHDNTQSLAYGSTGNIRGGYMRLIEQFQAAGAPFLGYLHSNGFCVARTDRHKPEKIYKVTYDRRIDHYRVGRNYTEKMTESRLKALQCYPYIDKDRIEITGVTELPKEGWYQLSKPTISGIRKAAQKIRRHQGFGQPYLLETVESDGDTTTYVRYG